MLVPNVINKEKFDLKKKTALLLLFGLSSAIGIASLSKEVEWEFDLTFKAKSETQTEFGQVTNQQDKIDKEIVLQ